MGKICKHANLYDKDGNLIRKVNEEGVLENYSIAELEMLIDQLSQEKDENGNILNPNGLNYANGLLMSLYMKYGNPHEEEILEKLKAQYGEDKSTQELVQSALKDLNKDLGTDEETVMDEYIEPIEEENVDEQRDIEPNNA